MRIIAGTHRSRKLNTLEGQNTRPTSDKIKEALFSSIGPYFEGGKVLDLFGGCGSIALEAISRGITEAYLCDSSEEALRVIKANATLLKEEEHVHIIKGDYKRALTQWQEKQFDFIYIDPPYALKVYDEILSFIDEHDMLADYGYLVVESAKGEVLQERYGTLIKTKEKNYRVATLTYYQKEIEE